MWILQEKFIEKFGTDAMLHYGYGGWLTTIGCFFGIYGVLIAFVCVTLLALFKEFVLDGGFDKIDFWWSVYGSLTTVVIYSLVWLI